MKRLDLIPLLFADGQSVPQIAVQFGISAHSVREHIVRKKEELGLTRGKGSKVQLRQALIEATR